MYVSVCVCVCVCVCSRVFAFLWMYIVGLCRQCTLLFSFIAVDLLSATDALYFVEHATRFQRLMILMINNLLS